MKEVVSNIDSELIRPDKAMNLALLYEDIWAVFFCLVWLLARKKKKEFIIVTVYEKTWHIYINSWKFSYIFYNYHRASMCSSHKLIAHFVKELERFICDRATPPTIDKGVAMYAYGVSVYCVNVYILTFFISHFNILFISYLYVSSLQNCQKYNY